MADPWKRREVIGDCILLLGDALQIVPELGALDSVATDPPFGMAFRSNYRKVKHRAIQNDAETTLLQWACSLQARHSKYVFCRWDNTRDLPKPRSLVTWVKNNWSMGDLEHEHGRQTEVALFYPGAEHFFPDGRPSDVILAPRTGNNYHPTEKPVSLMERMIRWTDGVVLDPFCGSGSTLVACARLGRKGIGIELDPTHFETACKRVEEAYRQPDFFVTKPAPAEQLSLIGGEE